MERSSLTFQTLRNTTYSVISYIWPIFFTLFFTPVIITKLGIGKYGIYLYINTIVSFLGLLDLGLGTAVIKYIAEFNGRKDNDALKKLIKTSNSIFLLISIVGFIISSVLSIFANTYSSLILLGGIIFFANTVAFTYNSLFIALQRFDISAKIGTISITLSSVAMFVAVLLGGRLKTILSIQLIIAVIFSFVTYTQAKKLLPLAKFSLGWDKKLVKKLYLFGIIAMANNIAGTALNFLDRLIIPFYAGATGLTYYSMPGNAASRIPGISNTLGGTIFPTTSHLSGGDEQDRLKTLYLRSSRLIMLVSSALTIAMIGFADKILLIWLNGDFAKNSTEILIILALTNFILAIFGPISGFLMGLGKVKVLTYYSIVMAVLNGALLFVLLPRYGITGAAWAYLLSLLPIIFIFFHVEKKYLSLPNRLNYYKKEIMGMFIVSIITLSVDRSLSGFVTNKILLLLVGIISVLLYLTLYKILGFLHNDDWRDLKAFAKKIIPNSLKKEIKKILNLIKNFGTSLKQKSRKYFLPSTKKYGYNFAILTVKKIIYVDLAISNINSLHYQNANHKVEIYCDRLCADYFNRKRKYLNYPAEVKLNIVTENAEKNWQQYKIETLIQASKQGQILTDADGIWHDDPEINKDKITLLTIAYKLAESPEELFLIQKVFKQESWTKFNHYVTGFVSIPVLFMTESLEKKLKEFNEIISKEESSVLRRLSEELAVNLAIQSEYSDELILTLKKTDGPDSKNSLQSLYYGCLNNIIE